MDQGAELATGRQSVNHHCFDTAALCVLYPAKVRLIYPRLRPSEPPLEAGERHLTVDRRGLFVTATQSVWMNEGESLTQ